MSDKLINATNLKKSFDQFIAVDNIDLSVSRGEVVGFLGPNGAGKSTTMKMLTGFLEPDNGEIFINGGEAYNDQEFSIFTPEIYNVKNQSTRKLKDAYFRRNYHSSSILLPDGRILVSGGDVWNSEIFYPPYLFEKDWENNKVERYPNWFISFRYSR